ncbi:Protein arginine N-methyltransferase 2 [Hondaea fermentalgiana]|uniref:Protein arginine N-methyltransferase 2 n=1 Tax=Hondaea fermentalgiana TaxID=2315210 RepID=A0A2R5GA67_9STRA|nr:Protein arginine N-methyltransferase 2 [Hondaea fermentalgiana]|eukprot:GBG27475.1 Protein arginine N-methyltransferase 2 [Hondaea fermentalgiana]
MAAMTAGAELWQALCAAREAAEAPAKAASEEENSGAKSGAAPGPAPGPAPDAEGLLAKTQSCLDKDPENASSYQDEESGASVLMVASQLGLIEVVKTLLERGAPWNALDRKGRCAGEYALEAGHQAVVDLLVDHGVRAEMLLGAIEKRKLERGPMAANEDYLKSNVEYTSDEQKLMDPNGDAVMMEWERPLMQLHAQVICQRGALTAGESSEQTPTGDVLNVGFGMGIVDSYIQEHKPRRHVIIEAHPQVYKRMLDDGWDKKPGVEIVFGRWQDRVASIGQFDGIFFDTYGEYYADLKAFQDNLPRLLRPSGVYSFFNGLCPRNIFFHGVCCQVVQLQLDHMGIEASFQPCELEADANADDTWQGVKRRYWWNDTYYLPICVMRPTTAATDA